MPASRAIRLGRVVRALHAGATAAARELGSSSEPEPPLPPPPQHGPHFGVGRTAAVAKVAFLLGIALLALLALDAAGSLPSSWVAYYRLATAAVLLPVGGWLVLRAQRIRPGLRAHPLRPRALRHVPAVMDTWRARSIERLLELTGIVMLAVGILELVLGLVHVH